MAVPMSAASSRRRPAAGGSRRFIAARSINPGRGWTDQFQTRLNSSAPRSADKILCSAAPDSHQLAATAHRVHAEIAKAFEQLLAFFLLDRTDQLCAGQNEIGRASCRERVEITVCAVAVKK